MTRERWNLLLNRGLLPAAVGAGLSLFWTPGHPVVPQGIVVLSPGAKEPAERPFPEGDDEAVKLAAFAGRPGEARLKAKQALTAGASDKELTGWLAPVLISDPGWLDKFLETVPDDRRKSLIKEIFAEVTALQPDAMWEMIRRSPAARAAAFDHDYTNRPIPKSEALQAPSALEALLDPAMDIWIYEFTSNRPANEVFSPDDCKRIMDACRDGRWKDQNDAWWLAGIWESFHQQSPAAADAWRKSLPPEMEVRVAGWKPADEPDASAGYRPPTVEELAVVSLTDPVGLCCCPVEDGDKNLLEQTIGISMDEGRPVSLETLAALTDEEQRHAAVEAYVTKLYPLRASAAMEMVNGLEQLPLAEADRQTFLGAAATAQWEKLGDLDTAMGWVSRISDPDERKRTGLAIMSSAAEFDPQQALAYAATLPPGPEREDLESTASAFLP